MARFAARRSAIGATLFAAALLLSVLHSPCGAQGTTQPSRSMPAPAPASGLTWSDVVNDAGRAVSLTWKLSPDDDGRRVLYYYVERSNSPAGPWTIVDSTVAGVSTRTDEKVRRNTDYFYRITTVGPGGRTPALSVTGPVRATSQWINQTRTSP